ncbi:hypothetical protein FDECE_15410 [Fusarium decemcellulare]|nr:hypothetical protein FDECE_15410 [Fusarium decemcellulare]
MTPVPESVVEISDDSDANADSDGEDWKARLLFTLDRIQATGKIATFNHYPTFANPGLEIDGERLIPLPLTEHDAQALKSVCRQAPFGRGDDTVVDTSVRNTWELDHSQFRLASPQWPKFLDLMLKDTATGLGLPQVTVKPHKLLLYEPGSFFKRHKDSEKETGMMGTLVICLPSQHQGAEVNLSFGSQKCTFTTASTSKFDVSSIAWFSDVTHEVTELTSGYRLVLTYKVFGPAEQSLSASGICSERQYLKATLVNWHTRSPDVERLMYPLDHKYTKSSLSLDNMKGRDRALCHSLQSVCSDAGFYLMFAHLTHSTTEDLYGYSDDGEEDDTTLESVYDINGNQVASNVSVELEETIGYDISDEHPDSEEEGEYTGNESAPSQFRYHTTVILLSPKMQVHQYLTSTRGMGDNLTKMVCDDLKKVQDDNYTRHVAAVFMAKATEASLEPETIDLITRWALKLGNADLFRACIRTTTRHGDVRAWAVRNNTSITDKTSLLVSRRLAECLSDQFSGKEEAIDWDHWNFESFIQAKPLLDAFKSWAEPALEEKIKAQGSWTTSDHQFLSRTLKSHCANTEWVLQTLLPTIVPRADRDLLWDLLTWIFAESSQTLTNAKDLFQCVFQHSGQKLCLTEGDFGRASLRFIRVFRDGYALGVEKEALDLLEKGCRRLMNRKHTWSAVSVDSLGGDMLVPLVRAMKNHNISRTQDVGKFLEYAFRRIRTSVDPPPAKPKGWAHLRRRGCSESSCKDCPELNAFLRDPDRQAWHFSAGAPRRKHIEECLFRDPIYSCKTVKNKSPHTLVVTKQRSDYDEALRAWKAEFHNVDSLVDKMRSDYLKDFLGDDNYQKLILMEDLTATATSKRKGTEHNSPKTKRSRV